MSSPCLDKLYTVIQLYTVKTVLFSLITEKSGYKCKSNFGLSNHNRNQKAKNPEEGKFTVGLQAGFVPAYSPTVNTNSRKEQAEAEVVPRSSLVEVQVEAQVGVEVGVVRFGCSYFHNADELQI